MSGKELEALAAQVKKLSSPDKLHLAAELLTAGRAGLGLQIAGDVVDRLRLAVLLGKQVDRDMELAKQAGQL